MGTCVPKFTFLHQKRADFPNLGARNSTVTFFLEKRPLKVAKRPQKSPLHCLKATGVQGSEISPVFRPCCTGDVDSGRGTGGADRIGSEPAAVRMHHRAVTHSGVW